jgi:hypothetical protein
MIYPWYQIRGLPVNERKIFILQKMISNIKESVNDVSVVFQNVQMTIR